MVNKRKTLFNVKLCLFIVRAVFNLLKMYKEYKITFFIFYWNGKSSGHCDRITASMGQ